MNRISILSILPILPATVLLGLPGCGRPETPSPKKKKKIVIRQIDDGKKSDDDSSNKKTTDGDKPKKPKTSKYALRPITPPESVRLDDITPEKLKAFIAEQTSKRRVVVVDYWATWCAPCKKLFPHTVELSKQHAKDGLVVISMCVDEFENRARAKTYVESQKANIYNFFPHDKLDPDTLAEQFNVPVYPLYRIYGPDGELAAEVKPPQAANADDIPELMKKQIDVAVKTALGLE